MLASGEGSIYGRSPTDNRPAGLSYLPTKSAMMRMSSPTSNGFAK
jgi:hypothetical protein